MRAVACAGLMLAAGAAGAQTPPPTVELLCDPGSYPYDAVAAAPLQHKVMFEDEHVRVLQINLPPYQAEPIHIHALPSVIEGDRDPAARFAYVTYRFQNGRFVEAERQEIAPSGGYAATWTAPEGPHSIVNLSAVWVRFTRIEIKPEGCAGR